MKMKNKKLNIKHEELAELVQIQSAEKVYPVRRRLCLSQAWRSNGGIATIELLIAFAIIVLALTGVIVVVFGNQSITLDAELNNLALYKAREKVEEAFAQVKAGNGVINIPDETDGIFTVGADVLSADCYWVINGKADWQDGTRSQDIVVPTKFVNIEASEAQGHTCDTGGSNDDWKSPRSYDIADPIHPGSVATGLSVLKYKDKKLVFITSRGSGDTFWVIDVTDSTAPDLVAQYDNENNVYDIDSYIEGDTAYSFVATASSTAQVQVMQVDLAGYPGTPPTITRIAAEPLSGTSASGRSIFYYDKKVYVGTREATGPEFHMFDAATPGALAEIGSGLEINHTIRDISVQGDYAYLAATAQTSEGCELIVIDTTSPTNPCLPHSTSGDMNFRAPGLFDGTAVDTAGGSTVYLGRETAGSDGDFYVLNASDIHNISEIGREDLDLNAGREVVGITVEVVGEKNLAFISTTDTTPANGGGPFMVYDVSTNPADPELVSTCPFNYSEKATGLGFLDGKAYVSNESQDALRIVYPSLVCS